MFNKRLLQCGLWFIKDLFSEGRLIPFNIWKQRGANNAEFLLWRGIAESVCRKYGIIEDNVQDDDDLSIQCGVMYNDNITSIHKCTQKHLKCVMKTKKYDKCEKSLKYMLKYEEMHNVQHAEWKSVNSLAKNILMDNSIIEMQFKIVHRIIGTNKLLYKIGKVASPTCGHCNMYMETIEHVFFECLDVRNFWLSLVERWNRYYDNPINICCKDVLLGYEVRQWKNMLQKTLPYCMLRNTYIHVKWVNLQLI